jgi:hypothetical protein
MPRDGSGIYVKPFPDVVEGTTIESTVHNGEISDIEYDLNAPRPIVAGGTGANNAHDAMIALSGEIAKQVVTNYDSFPFVNGSFTSTAGATSEPTAGGNFNGIYYEHANTAFATIEAREINSGILYIRQKVAGVWGAWKQQAGSTADLDAAYVNVTGDTMTGYLGISRSTAVALTAAGKENPPSLIMGDAYAVFHSANGGYGALSIGGRSGSPYSAWLQSHNTGGTVLPLEINPVAGEIMLGSADSAVTVKGVINASAKGHLFGSPTGASGRGPVAVADANIILYGGGANWAGIGSDGSGEMWFRTGLSGTPTPPLIIKNDLGVAVQTATASTSPTTGALTVAGGVGVAGTVSAGAIRAGNVPASNPYTNVIRVAADKNLAFIPDGASVGLYGINDAANVEVPIKISNGIASTSPTTGALTVAGGLGVAEKIWANSVNATGAVNAVGSLSCGGPTVLAGAVAVNATTATTSPTTGALTVAGGAGFNQGVNITGTLNVGQVGNSTVSTLSVFEAGAARLSGVKGQPLPGSNCALAIQFQGTGTQYGICLRPTQDNTPYLLFTNSAEVAIGQISGNGSNISYITSSDERLKEDLRSFDAGNIIDETNVYNFAWKKTGERDYGVIAQQAVSVYPNAVSYLEKEDFWGVDYSKYVPVLLQELKALRERVRYLEGKVGVGIQPA